MVAFFLNSCDVFYDDVVFYDVFCFYGSDNDRGDVYGNVCGGVCRVYDVSFSFDLPTPNILHSNVCSHIYRGNGACRHTSHGSGRGQTNLFYSMTFGFTSFQKEGWKSKSFYESI